MVPKPGTDDAHDAGLEAMKAAEASLEDERKKWAAELGDRTIEFWTPQGNTSEPYQLCVSEATLGRTGVPEEFEMVSQKKVRGRDGVPADGVPRPLLSPTASLDRSSPLRAPRLSSAPASHPASAALLPLRAPNGSTLPRSKSTSRSTSLRFRACRAACRFQSTSFARCCGSSPSA